MDQRERDLKHVMQAASDALRRMNLPKLYMALALGRLDGRVVELSGAGMPPALLYRAASGEIERIPLKGLPLGSGLAFSYQKRRVELAAGDTLLLMSDGLPELRNETGEMVGYDGVVGIFEEVAARSPDEIVHHLRHIAASWMNGRSDGAHQDDDITFVVMQARKSGGRPTS